ncbi:hypothetical protein T11_17972 [Trichinella zimbabwensis]|uniref:Uncharacterized protein n=1 Tax=Trichinella zimbabwensis TaxID=268475 RepID=A0A0V1HA38_9BILA|nr:hypothetical protein T11_17972 [Trichinella zimbabwensis]
MVVFPDSTCRIYISIIPCSATRSWSVRKNRDGFSLFSCWADYADIPSGYCSQYLHQGCPILDNMRVA